MEGAGERMKDMEVWNDEDYVLKGEVSRIPPVSLLIFRLMIS